MLLLIALTLKGAITITPTPTPPPPTLIVDGGGGYSNYKDRQKEQEDRIKRIILEDDEFFQIIKIWVSECHT